MNRLALASLLLIASAAHAQDLLRVVDPAKQPPDSRLAKARDYNSTTIWDVAYSDKSAWEKRAQEVREQILVSNGLYPLPEKTPLNPVIHGKIDRGDYTVEKVYFSSFPGHYVTGSLYRPVKAPPEGQKLPVVLYAHGHWKDGRLYEASDAEAKKVVESGGEKTMEGAKFPLQAPCAQLARMGCVVFAYNMVGVGDSQPFTHREGFKDADADAHLQSFMGLQTWNSIRVVDFVSSLPEVDAGRIAITGASGGGTQTMILAAIDPRVAVAFPAVMVSQNMQGGCVCENASLMRTNTNNIEFAAVFAPKPQGISAANDWTADLETRGLPQLKSIYALYGAADNVAGWHRPFPHNYNQVSRELMYNWFNKHLKLNQAEPVAEKPFTPIPPKQLSVWDEQHPLPKDAADATALRKTWHDLSDKSLNHMIASDPQEYRRIITQALKVMINDKWPVNAQVVEGSKKETRGEKYLLETGLLTRGDEGAVKALIKPNKNGNPVEYTDADVAPIRSAMPYAMFTPNDWNGETVLWHHPAGKLTLTDENAKPLAPVQRMLDAKFAVLAGDLFGTGEYLNGGKTPPELRRINEKFAGYTFGYNRPLIAERVHDILTLVAYAKSGKQSKFVHQIALEGAGAWALLAKGLAGEAILRSAIDLNGFDFDQVKDVNDENFLPGAQKYGGIATFISLCRVGETALYRLPPGKDLTSMPLPSRGVREGKGKMVDWTIREGQMDHEEVPRR